MAHDEDYIDESAEVLSSVARWVPFTVVFVALGGFLLLGWYAYKAGTQSLSDDELLVVEADDTPIKEKPEDPGGMQFPNKDKMIFETFSSKPGEHPKVERLMPEPEEPVVIKADTTTTWVNDSAQKNAAKAEDVAKEVKDDFVKVAAMDKKSMPIKEESVDSFRKKASAAPAVPKVPTVPKVVEKPKPKPKAKPAPKPVAKGKMLIQLGAYSSNSEAKSSWKKIQKKHGRLLSGYGYRIVRADLGTKGVYYRLRVPGFSSIDSAKSFCKKLSAKGQACMAIKG